MWTLIFMWRNLVKSGERNNIENIVSAFSNSMLLVNYYSTYVPRRVHCLMVKSLKKDNIFYQRYIRENLPLYALRVHTFLSLASLTVTD